MHKKLFICLALLAAVTGRAAAGDADAGDWNRGLAARYLDDRAKTWFEFSGADRGMGPDKISCISCHSVVPFTLARPALRRLMAVNEPTVLEAKRIEQTKKRVEHWKELDSEKYRLFYDFSDQKKKESWGTEAVLNALFLAFDDHYRGNKTSETTRRALANLWQVQISGGDDAGSWEWLDFGLEPWETKKAKYFGAALAALAVGTAPGYYASGADADLDRKVDLLRGYLRVKLELQNLNNRIWVLWASAKLDGLLTKDERTSVVQAIFQKQQPDGGWSLSSLGTMSPSNFSPDTHSDGYATGLILHVLQTAGIAKQDAKVARGLTWLRSHQEKTGGWRANSVNKERDPSTHVGKFMSDAATAYAVLALSH